MSSEDTEKDKKRQEALRNTLNRHGYGFQYRVVREIIELSDRHRFPWVYIAPEFPVAIQGAGTRIDFILEHKHLPLYILAECKRANPRFSNWCFLQIPYRAYTRQRDAVRIEIMDRAKQSTHTKHVINPRNGIYDIAREIKTDMKGDAHPTGRGQEAIEDAATQICRGLNGIIQFSIENINTFTGNNYIGFLPVIFTTAKLYTSTTDISFSDLESGKLPSLDDLEEKSWLFYHYYQSPGLKHSIPSSGGATKLADILYQEYVRTIPIVSALGIYQFLNYDYWRDPDWWNIG